MSSRLFTNLVLLIRMRIPCCGNPSLPLKISQKPSKTWGLRHRPSSVLELQGADGRTIRDHSKNCAPCHLPNLDPTIITSTWIPPLDYPCQICQRIDNVDQMLLCDNYNDGYHLFCLKLKLIQVPVNIWYYSSCSLIAPWFLLRPCHTFFGLGLGGNTWEFHFSFLLCIVYICVCISFWLISFYLWLVLIFLFNRVYYGLTPLQHWTSRHYMSRQLSCPYAWPHTWRPITGMPIMPLGLMYVLRLLYAIGVLGLWLV
jgi:hypothetical protein